MKKEKVVIGLPISFMKKGDFGYVSYQYTPLVYDDKDTTDLADLKINRLISKKAGIFKFSMNSCVRITKIGEGFEAKDFVIHFPLDLAIIPQPLSSIQKNEYLDGSIEVDWSVLEENSVFSSDDDLSNYTYLELCDLVTKYSETVNFPLIRESAEKIFEYVPNAMKLYLESFDKNYLPIFQEGLLVGRREEFEEIPDSDVKTFIGDFYDLAILTLKDYIDESNGILPNMVTDLEKLSKSELQKLMDQALEVKDWKLVEKIDNLLK